MRSVVLIVTAALALLAASTALAHAKRDSARPTVRITQFSPLIVAGERFRPAQRIVIRVTTPSTRHVTVKRTTARGTFVARFAAATFTGDRCGGGLSVVVTTASGITAVAKSRIPETLCPPPLSPLGGPMP
jgi:hypothetical protein